MQTHQNLIPLPTTQGGLALHPELAEAAASYIKASKSPATMRAYRSAWRSFSSWCRQHGTAPMPASPITLIGYLSDRAQDLKVSSIEQHLAAIGEAHRVIGHVSPTTHPQVKMVMKGIRNTHGEPATRKSPMVVADLKAILGTLAATASGHRDAAMLLLGFGAALRRSEVVGLDVEDLTFMDEGLVILIRRSKTDQEGHGHRVAVGYGTNPTTCPVTATRRWLATANIKTGPVFRQVDRHGHVREARLRPRAVARIVKRLGAEVGLDPDRLGGHSLRAGFATSAARVGIAERDIARTTRHRSIKTLRTYVREGEMFTVDATQRLGL